MVNNIYNLLDFYTKVDWCFGKVLLFQQPHYYLPNLIDTASVSSRELGKYGRMRLNYLKEHKYAEYIILWSENKLRKHLKDIDRTANSRFDLLMKQFAERENITEELKATNQLEWVYRMNSIKNRVEEIIFSEIIYK